MHSVKDDLDYFNGFGGFTRDGREYVLSLEEDNRPPAPWINVISNPGFGFSVSETGAGSTWAFNSRENKITPWSNDPVCDQASEAIYIRDNTTGNIITPMSLGRSDRGGYMVRHGFGYSVFHHDEGGLKQELTGLATRKPGFLRRATLPTCVPDGRSRVSFRITETWFPRHGRMSRPCPPYSSGAGACPVV